MVICEAINVSVERGGKRILDQASMTVEEGEFLAILGPNGAGKSTLLSCLTKKFSPTIGNVWFNGKCLKHWSSEALALVRSVVSQEQPMSFQFTVEEVIELGLYPHAISKEQAQLVVNDVLVRLGLVEMRKRVYPTLSGGEKQRVQLGRALTQLWKPVANCPRLLFLDEPTSSMDIENQYRILGHVKQLTQKGISAVVVLHDLNLAARYADRVALMSQGKLVACDATKHVLTREHIRNVFHVDAITWKHPNLGHLMINIADAVRPQVEGSLRAVAI